MLTRTKNLLEKQFRKIALYMIVLIFLMLIISIFRTSLFGEVEAEKHIFFEIVFLLLLAVLAEIAVVYLKQQTVIILMVVGMMISPSFMAMAWSFLQSIGLALPAHVPAIIREPTVINVFAQLGAIILLFKVGTHSKIERIFSVENLLVAVIGIILPFFGGLMFGLLNHGSFAYSMFIGSALAATSVGVTVAILKEMDVLSRKYADIIIGAAVIDDVLSLLLLSVVVNLASAGSSGALSSVISTFLTAAIFIIGAILSGKYFVEYFDRDDLGSKGFILSIAFMLGLAYIAEVIKLSAIVGSFLAGVILSKSRHYRDIDDKTYALETIFTPIFFLSLGMLIDFRALITAFAPILLITIIAMLTKMVGCGTVAFLSKLSASDSLKVGVGMVPRGEVALIIAAIGLSQGVLSTAEYSIISAMAVLTTLAVPPILAWLINRDARPSSS